DPRARRSATSNGHARARRAGCPGVTLSSVSDGSAAGEAGLGRTKGRGDGLRFRQWGRDVLPVDDGGRAVRRWPVLHLLVVIAALVPDLIADIETTADE